MAKGKKKKGAWPDWATTLMFSVGGPIIAGLFAWHLYAIFEMSKAIEVTADRTDRIAKALPGMGRFFARAFGRTHRQR